MIDKDQAAGALFEIEYILGAEVIIREMIKFMSLDEVSAFVDHIHQHYETRHMEAQYEQAFDDKFNEIPF